MRTVSQIRLSNLSATCRVRPAFAGAATLLLCLQAGSAFTQSSKSQSQGDERVAAAAISDQHPLAPAIKLAKASRKSLEDVKDYDCTFIKRERMRNGTLLTQTMHMKMCAEPFSVYLRFAEPNSGREILFVRGQNNNEILAHEGSGLKAVVGTVRLAVNSEQARAENRHPITDIGMHRMIDKLIVQWTEEARFGECNVQYYPDAKIGGLICPAIECAHPTPRNQFPFHVTRLYLDQKSNLPVRLENYGFPQRPNEEAPLIEEYTYVKIRTNVGMKEVDFSAENPGYKF